MTIERALANGNINMNVCELGQVMATENGKEVQYSVITAKELSAKDVLDRASDNGEYEIQTGDKIAKGTINEIIYLDPFNPLRYLLRLTFEEFVEQGRPSHFFRTLRYEPTKEKRK